MIKQAFSEKSQTEIENQTQTKSQTENHEVSDLVCVLQATIDIEKITMKTEILNNLMVGY